MKAKKTTPSAKANFILAAGLLLLILALLFYRSFDPNLVHFSNDGPLGAQNTEFLRFPDGISGLWDDINTIGTPAGTYAPTLTIVTRWILGPVGFSKFLAPLALFVLGLGAFAFYRQLRFTPTAVILGTLATVLNSAFFSAACWGVASQEVAIGMNFLALALVVSNRPDTPTPLRWVRYALAGCAVGMSVMEGLDNGAIFSVLIASFTLYYALTEEGPLLKKAIHGVLRVAVIAGFAGFLAAHTVISLVNVSVKGVAGAQQPEGQRWDFATTWSLPKRETIGLIVPGFFGFRMGGGPSDYWGAVGRDPVWDRYFENVEKGQQGNPPPRTLRFSGGGAYLGVPVAVLALWALVQTLNRKDSVYTAREKKLIWFWSVVSVISILLSFGRFAPFYRLVYMLPYFSTIRNPVKFIAVFEFCAVVLFAYGVNGLCRKYLTAAAVARPKGSWAGASGFDKRWVLGSILLVVACIVGWWGYAQMQPRVESYILELARLEALSRNAGFNVAAAQAVAHAQASFSVGQVGWAVLSLILSVGLVLLIVRGTFVGPRAIAGGVLLGLLVVADLGLANRNWIVHWDYKQKYDIDPAGTGASASPIIERLRQKPYEGRVAIMPNTVPYIMYKWFSTSFPITEDLMNAEQFLDQFYGLEWAQHHFPYYNIQSLDVIQMPRPPADLEVYESSIGFQNSPDAIPRVVRRWELTNTRYILGAFGWYNALNGALDPTKQRFRVVERFNFGLKPGVTHYSGRLEEITAVPDPNGSLALYEFTGALPRASLYSNWQMPMDDAVAMNALKTLVDTNEQAFLKQVGTNEYLTLRKLVSPSFDPRQLVLLATPLPPPPANTTNQDSKPVEFVSYKPADFVLKADAKTPSVLLLNDKYDPNWKVTVDRRPAELLRCNFIMRGVYLQPGTHIVEFRFRPAIWPLYVTVLAMLIAIGLLAYMVVAGRKASSAPQ